MNTLPLTYTSKDLSFKIENIERDLPIVFHDILGIKLSMVRHVNNVAALRGVEDGKERTIRYLNQLGDQTRLQLYEVYKHDFLMFDYNPY